MKTEKKSLDKLHQYFTHERNQSALIIAHRGGAKSFNKTENTLDIFIDAIENDVKMIEFDVRKTLDNEFIIFHDPKVDGQKIEFLTYKQLNEITKYPVPKFEEALKICSSKIMLDIELKEAGYEKEVLDILDRYYTPDHFVITSFHYEVIKRIKEYNPKIYAGLLIGKGEMTPKVLFSELFPFRRLKRTGADFVVPNYKLVTPLLLHVCKKKNLSIYVWTVNGDSTYAKLIQNRVDGIITDYPKRYSGQYKE